MESIEEDYEGVKGVLPKTEYQELDKLVLRDLLRTFNDPSLRRTVSKQRRYRSYQAAKICRGNTRHQVAGPHYLQPQGLL